MDTRVKNIVHTLTSIVNCASDRLWIFPQNRLLITFSLESRPPAIEAIPRFAHAVPNVCSMIQRSTEKPYADTAEAVFRDQNPRQQSRPRLDRNTALPWEKHAPGLPSHPMPMLRKSTAGMNYRAARYGRQSFAVRMPRLRTSCNRRPSNAGDQRVGISTAACS